MEENKGFTKGSLRLIGNKHDLKPQHKTFKGDILHPNTLWVLYGVCVLGIGLKTLVITEERKQGASALRTL